MDRQQRRRRVKGRAETGSFLQLPHALMEHVAFATLSPRANKLLLDIGVQYRGYNNGDLQMTWGTLSQRGWRSRDQLHKARRELLDRGLIAVTRQGGRGVATLYCLTWLPIHDCKGKLDIGPRREPLGWWKQWKPTTPETGRKGPELARDSELR